MAQLLEMAALGFDSSPPRHHSRMVGDPEGRSSWPQPDFRRSSCARRLGIPSSASEPRQIHRGRASKNSGRCFINHVQRHVRMQLRRYNDRGRFDDTWPNQTWASGDGASLRPDDFLFSINSRSLLRGSWACFRPSGESRCSSLAHRHCAGTSCPFSD